MVTQTKDKNSYFYVNGNPVPLIKEPSVFAVRFQRGEKSDSPRLSRRSFRLLHEELENIYFIPNYGIQIYRVTARVLRSKQELGVIFEDIASAVESLDHEDPVQYATPAYRRNVDSHDLMFATNLFAVCFKADVTEQQIDEQNTKYGVERIEPLGYCKNGYLLRAPEGSGEHSAIALANLYFESGLCDFATPNFVRKMHVRHSRQRVYEMAREFGLTNEQLLGILGDMHVDVKSHMSIVEGYIRSEVCERLREAGYISSGATTQKTEKGSAVAPATSVSETQLILTEKSKIAEQSQFLSQQWHLSTAKVTDAWAITRGKSSVTLAVLDNGVDTSHPEFSGKITRQFDFAANVADASPKAPGENHGTACAGVATAKGIKALGAAPDCSLIVVRTPDYLGMADEAQMFRWAANQGTDIISCSWGPEDGTGTNDVLPDTTRAAIDYCVTQGRSGKGIPIFWAAGNGNESVSLDGYASNPKVIAVAASTSNETRAWYSDFGPEISICAPSSGDSSLGEKRIFTVDRIGIAGYNPGDADLGDTSGDYTNDFGGTSSAAPLAAGIAGLMLSVNENLTYQQVREILQKTADKIAGEGNYDRNGHSVEYGYGRVNALEAVQLALGEGTGIGSDIGVTTISAPSSRDRSGIPATFQINLTSSNPFYAVEVATRAELFNNSVNGSERNDDNFYASWQDLPFQTASTFTLASNIWDRLKNTERLFYRMHTSSSSLAWENHTVTINDSQASSAPFIVLTGIAADTSTDDFTVPRINALASLNSGGSAPSFQINLTSSNPFYAVEVATRAELFNNSVNGSERNDDNYYASWQDLPFQTASTFTLASNIWDRLKNTERLFYRMHTSSSSLAWENHTVTINDSQASSAPFIILTASLSKLAARSLRSAPAHENTSAIVGPEIYERGAELPPQFQVQPGVNRYYAVEVATDSRLFNRIQNDNARTPDNFYASWRTGLLEANGDTIYYLPREAWQHLRNSDRLFYRIMTSETDSSDWSGFDCSTQDESCGEAPWINLKGGTVVKSELQSQQIKLPRYSIEQNVDEYLWRGRV